MNNKGFTLIELIMTIVILGILAVAIMPRIFSLTEESQVVAVDGIVGGIRAGINLYVAQQMAETGLETYPANLDSVPNDTFCSEATPCFVTVLKDPIIDPNWKHIGGPNWDYSPGAGVRHFHYDSGTGAFWED